MPHKQNPVAAIAVLGCTKQVPGLLATLAGAAEQEHQRAAGAWHAEWAPLSDLLRRTGSAASWAADMLTRLVPDPARMRANLDAAGGFPLAEHVAGAARAGPRPGRRARPGGPGQRAGRGGGPARCGTACWLGRTRAGWPRPGSPRSRLEQALDPAGYLGAAGALRGRRAGRAHKHRAEWPAMNDARATRPGDDRPPRGPGRCPRGPGGGRHHRLHRPVPGLHHPVRVGRGVVPARADPGRSGA